MKKALVLFLVLLLSPFCFGAKGTFTLKTVDLGGNPISNHQIKVKGQGLFESDTNGIILIHEMKIGKETTVEARASDLYRSYWEIIEFAHEDSIIIIELKWTQKAWDTEFKKLFELEMAQRIREVAEMENSGFGPCDSTNEDRVILNAKFPGGSKVMSYYISENLYYPDEAIDNDEMGKVIVGFTVLEDGIIGDLTIIQSASKSLDEEALRLVKGIPGMIPPYCNGVPIKFNGRLPFNFEMSEANY